MVNDMVFLHLSDIHFLRRYPKASSGYNSVFNEMTNPLIKIEKSLEKVTMDEVDFIIITGDLVESGTADDYKTLKEKFEFLFKGVPYFITLGNHDNKKEFYKGWFDREDDNEPYNVVGEIKGLRIIGLDISEYHNNDGAISQKQCEWLREELSKDNRIDTILFLHHHLLRDQFNTPSVHVPNEFKNIIKESSIVSIFTGHTHHVYSGVFAGKPYFTGGSLSFAGFDESDGLVRFEDAGTINKCEYKYGEIKVETIFGINENKFLGYVNFREQDNKLK
ncbi:metallophosphoesterase family protein [Clostridium culturomicium]|uniref:metallophosphoesterase family protein n=1 Tax=Clostridium culturomicium TaxID=1499683 RepID=UPI000694C9D7|nr:metallophosphoesterase [Clostridium culturomicium]